MKRAKHLVAMEAMFKRFFGIAALALTLAIPASSQYWEEAGLPDYSPAPTVIYTDTVHDQLIVASQNLIYDHSYMPLFRYNGVQWDTLGLFGNQVHSAVVYHDTLIVGGGFDFMKDTVIKNIACYAGGGWHPYGDMGDEYGDGVVEGLRVIDGELYAVGMFTYADGQLCNGLAKRVGGHWEPLAGWSAIPFFDDPWLHDIIRFQNKLVVGGSFSTSDNSLTNMVQYNGNAWVPVCANCLTGGYDGVAKLAEYQGELYVAGIFYYSSGNAGQGIMRWDGQQWYSVGPVGDGIQVDNYSDQYSPDISDLQVRDGLLYIGGGYDFVDHIFTPAGICTWDGSNFCLLQGSHFSDYYAPFAFYHDTLYGGTSSGVTDPALRGVIRYLGAFCSGVGVEEVRAADAALQVVSPEPGSIAVLGLADGPHELRIYDAQGRLVTDERIRSGGQRSNAIPVDLHAAALYILRLDADRVVKYIPLR